MLLLPHGVHLNEEVELDNEEVGVLEVEVVILLPSITSPIVLDEVIELGVEVGIFFKSKFPKSLRPP